MPGCAVHLELASRVLRSWSCLSSDRPFPPLEPPCRDAFLFGSLAPDLGYFPGGDRLLSDLAHYFRSGELARNLVASARTDAERGFAWGWATHVLADVWIHPLVNQAAAESITSQRRPGLSYADDPPLHVRVEQGLDAAMPALADWSDPPPFGSVCPSTFEVLARAYHQTYGLVPSRARFCFTARCAQYLVPAMLLGGKIISAPSANRWARWTHRGLAKVIRHSNPGGLLDALFNPLSPPAWLVEEVRSVVDAFDGRFHNAYAAGLVDLLDYNLDTGEVEGSPPAYALAVAALESLGHRVGLRQSTASKHSS